MSFAGTPSTRKSTSPSRSGTSVAERREAESWVSWSFASRSFMPSTVGTPTRLMGIPRQWVTAMCAGESGIELVHVGMLPAKAREILVPALVEELRAA